MKPKVSMIINGHDFFWGNKTFVSGILNLTPDSFSGDGLSDNIKSAISQAIRFQEEGADFLDVGGEFYRLFVNLKLS